MTTHAFRGLLIATAAAAILTATAAQAATGPTVSKDVGKQLTAAQKATEAKDWAGAKAAIAAARAVTTRTPFDDYEISAIAIYIDVQSGDFAAATADAQATADSPAQPDADKPKNLKNAAMLSVNAKQYDKALAYAKALQATTPPPTDASTLTTMAQAFYSGKDYTDAIAIEQKRVDSDVAANKLPDRNALEILMSSQAALKQEADAEKTLETLVADFNDPTDWSQMIEIALGTPGVRDVDVVWLGRLMFARGETISPQDASAVGQTASHLTFYGDAQQAQQSGGTGFPDAAANAAKDKKSMAQQIAAGAKQGGQYNVKLAEALYGYGMYPEAEAAVRAAIQKGGAADASEPPMVLGQVLTAEGKYDDAIAAFKSVTGGGPATARVARLWVYHVNSKKNPTTATAAH